MKSAPGRGITECQAVPDEDDTKASAALQRTPRDDSSETESNNSSMARRVAMPGSSNASSSSDNEASKDGAMPRSHRAVDVLRQSPVVEMHRTSSGRNLQLKHLSVADGALLSAPNALTPRAPSGRRPESRQRLHSADCSNNNSSSNNRDSLSQRSSSFSISAHVLKDLERVRLSTDPEGLAELYERPEHHPARCSDDDDDDDLQQKEDSSDESEEIHWDTRGDISHNNSEVHHRLNQAEQEEEQVEGKAVSTFGLWGKAAKNKRLPDAIIFSGSAADECKVSHSRLSSASSSSRVQQPMETSVPTVSEMVSQLHVTHPHLAALSALDVPKSMSLPRSTSPRIGRSGFSSWPDDTSLRRASSVPTNNQQMAVEAQASSTLEVSNPITQWKRGELIGEGTFGRVRGMQRVRAVAMHLLCPLSSYT